MSVGPKISGTWCVNNSTETIITPMLLTLFTVVSIKVSFTITFITSVIVISMTSSSILTGSGGDAWTYYDK